MTAPDQQDTGRLAHHAATTGDADATQSLFTRIRPRIERYCRARLGWGRADTADDVTQEVCMAVLRSLPQYEQTGAPFVNWVYSIAARKVADVHRTEARRAGYLADDIDQWAPATDIGPADQAIMADIAEHLSRLLDRLTPDQREIITLRIAVGLTADEVGKAMGMSASGVRVAQTRALEKLRRVAEVGRPFDGIRP